MRRARGFSLVEAAVATLIVAGLLVASLEAVGHAASGRRSSAERAEAALLAQMLLSEIVALPYADPQIGTGPLGAEAGEPGRAAFDDIDDYHNISESPPTDSGGIVLVDTTGWSRRVEVAWVLASDPTQIAPADTGIKRIRVIVSRGGAPTVLSAIRTRAGDSLWR